MTGIKSEQKQYDLIVVGGGASGLMMAGRAAELGARVLIVEKNARMGEKLRITGGGRCNIYNAEFDTKELLKHYGDAAKYLHSSFSQFAAQESADFFNRLGLPTVVQARKRAFPESEKALDVYKVLEKYCKKYGVEFLLNSPVLKINTSEKQIIGIQTAIGTITAPFIAIATGGLAAPETGSTGDGFKMLSRLGYSIAKPDPNIVPLASPAPFIHELSGTTWSFMKIRFIQEGKTKIRRTGKILFTHFGISGPLILNVAREVKNLVKDGPVTASIDFFPDTEENELNRRIWRLFEQNKNKQIKNVLPELLDNKIAKIIIEQSGVESTTKTHSVTKQQRDKLTKTIKGFQFPITGTLGWDKAVIADGGVSLDDVDTKTFASRKHPNLYLIGDTLHINRPSGGFSLQLCWTSAWVSANNLAHKLFGSQASKSN